MAKLEFRTLRADEIECRVGTATQKGISLVMYKNARIDMALLDEVVGVDRWKRTHEVINDNLFCTVAIKFDDQWVEKQDVGVESYTEKEKGQASDAFKRACVNWGIGRELYTCPFVWINLADNEWDVRNCKKYPRTRFYVSDIQYDDNRKVSFLEVRDNKQTIRFTYGRKVANKKQPTQVMQEHPQPQVTSKSVEQPVTFESLVALIKQTTDIQALRDICTNNPTYKAALIPECQSRINELEQE